jgi:glucan 1,3-beta-glucosidase
MKLVLFLLADISSVLAAAFSTSTINNYEVDTGSTCTLRASKPTTFWYEAITHNGISPFIEGGTSWPVFRNVRTSYGAKGDGQTDDSAAIQAAINAGNHKAGRDTGAFGTTGQPAVVYLPGGVYRLKRPLQMYMGTVLVGDAINAAVLMVDSNFIGNFVVYGKDPHQISVYVCEIGVLYCPDLGYGLTRLGW